MIVLVVGAGVPAFGGRPSIANVCEPPPKPGGVLATVAASTAPMVFSRSSSRWKNATR